MTRQIQSTQKAARLICSIRSLAVADVISRGVMETLSDGEPMNKAAWTLMRSFHAVDSMAAAPRDGSLTA